MTVMLDKEEYFTTKNGYLRRKDDPSRKVKEEDVVTEGRFSSTSHADQLETTVWKDEPEKEVTKAETIEAEPEQKRD